MIRFYKQDRGKLYKSEYHHATEGNSNLPPGLVLQDTARVQESREFAGGIEDGYKIVNDKTTEYFNALCDEQGILYFAEEED